MKISLLVPRTSRRSNISVLPHVYFLRNILQNRQGAVRMIIVIRFKYVMIFLISLLFLGAFLFGRFVTIRKEADGALGLELVSFLPLRTELVPERFTVTSADPRQTFHLAFSRRHPFKVAVFIREHRFPKGSPVTVKLTKLPTWLPGITRSFHRTILPRIKPALLRAPPALAGTRNPIVLAFNTPLRRQGLERLIKTDFSAKLAPCRYRVRRQFFTDYATWRITPTRPLQYRHAYQVILSSELAAICGQKLGQSENFRFTTVGRLKVVAQNPVADSGGFLQYQPLRMTVDRQLRRGRVRLRGHCGETVIGGKTLIFTPSPVLLPDTTYQARITLVDCFGEFITAAWRFRTAKSVATDWVEVNLRIPQTVTVYRDQQPRKVIRASGPAPGSTRLRGVFPLRSRGYAFYASQLQEGAYYWLRLANGWLIHSFPFGPDGQIRVAQASGLGQPGGEPGSIRLALADIRWLYQNLPPETPVIIHGPPPVGEEISDSANRYEKASFFNYRAEYERFMKQNR
jgi:hypothetical protein